MSLQADSNLSIIPVLVRPWMMTNGADLPARLLPAAVGQGPFAEVLGVLRVSLSAVGAQGRARFNHVSNST